jgi:hypothetical protein
VRARLLASNGVLVVAPESNVDLDAGAMTAAEVPELVSLALACTAMPARTQVTIYASLGGAEREAHCAALPSDRPTGPCRSSS